MSMRISLAGRVEIEVDGVAVDLSRLGGPGRLYLAYLVCERHRPVPRDELAEVLWGEDLPRSWEQMLRGNATKLRTVVAGAGSNSLVEVVSAFGAVQVRLPPEAVVDVEEAGRQLEEAEAALQAGRAPDAQRAAAAAATVAAGGFLPGWSGIWVERRQAELRELRLHALEVMAQAASAQGLCGDAVAAAEEAVALEPFRESAYQILMNAHRDAGNPGEGLRAYERCRRALADELGVSPSAATESIYLALLSGDAGPASTRERQVPLPKALAAIPGAFLVGRDGAAETLRAALQRAATEGRQAVVIGGEPGIGKTSVVADFARGAHAGGATVLYGRCDEELGVAYQPFAEALGHYIAHCAFSELTEHVESHGTELARIVPELLRRLPDAPPPLVTGSEGDRYRVFEAISALVERACVSAPLVLVLDDLHWAAPPTLALLRRVLRGRTSPLVVVGTYRHTEVGANHPLTTTLADLRREPGVERMLLEGLDEHGVSAFVQHTTGDVLDDAALGLARALHSRTAGNPFFVGEFLRHLSESGAVYQKAGTWSYYEDAEGLGLPEGVRDVVARRLGRLSDTANRVLTIAAVVGLQFELDLLERFPPDGGSGGDTTLDGLDEAVAAHVITELGYGRYQFAHALVRDTIYATLTATRRARLHYRVGDALASLPGDLASRLPALVHHFVEAASDGAGLRAGDYAIAAARQALDKTAWDDAHEYVKLGLASLSSDEPEHLERRFELLLLEAEIFLLPVANELAQRSILEAAETARALMSPERLARAISLHLLMFGPWDPRSTGPAEETLVRLDDSAPALRARLLAGLAVSVTYRRDGRAEATSREALALARESGDADAIYAGLVARTAVLANTELASERLALEDELLRVGFPSGPVAGTRWMYSLGRGRAITLLVLGDRAAFEDEVEAVRQRVAAFRTHGGRWQLALWRATVALLDGRFSEVEELAEKARALVPVAVEQWTVQVGEVAIEQGRARDFLDQLRESLTIEPANASLLAMLAFVLAEVDEHDEARAVVADLAADDFLWVMREPTPSSTLAYVTEAVVALGDADTAARLYERLRPYGGLAVVDRSAAHCGGAADRYLGQLAATLGRWDAAETQYEAAVTLEAGLRSPPVMAWTRYWYGQMLVERGRKVDADRVRNLLSSAVETAELLGMARLRAQAAALR